MGVVEMAGITPVAAGSTGGIIVRAFKAGPCTTGGTTAVEGLLAKAGMTGVRTAEGSKEEAVLEGC